MISNVRFCIPGRIFGVYGYLQTTYSCLEDEVTQGHDPYGSFRGVFKLISVVIILLFFLAILSPKIIVWSKMDARFELSAH